jgi:WD40 repeat protein
VLPPPCLQAHPVGVISLEFERPGHNLLLIMLLSTCCRLRAVSPPPHTHTYTSQAHPGGVVSLEFERPGHLLATCGADKTVQTWDLNTFGHVTTFHVSAASHNPQPLRDHRPICWSHIGSVEVSVGNSHSRDTCVGRLETCLCVVLRRACSGIASIAWIMLPSNNLVGDT